MKHWPKTIRPSDLDTFKKECELMGYEVTTPFLGNYVFVSSKRDNALYRIQFGCFWKLYRVNVPAGLTG
jgi:hypothetical protein